MATLIQSKQIEGVVTASVIEGDFVVSGSILVTDSGIFANNVSASNTITAAQFVGDGSLLTGVVASGTGISFETGSVKSTITKIEISGSGIDVDIVNSNTASLSVKSPYEVGGLFRTYETLNELNELSISYFSQGQIVYITETNELYQATITYADFVNLFEDVIEWNLFTFVSGENSITAGDGLVKTFENGVTNIALDTGSLHFQNGVETIISNGSFTIDAGAL
jgi:hypothetical protein